jgi:hypothetical protein
MLNILKIQNVKKRKTIVKTQYKKYTI